MSEALRRVLPAMALLSSAMAVACPGPEPHLRAGSGGAGATGPGGAGGDGGAGGAGGTCGNHMVDLGEICFKPIVEATDANGVGVGAVLDLDNDGDLDLTGLGNQTFYAF
jgi:hypothetical protein